MPKRKDLTGNIYGELKVIQMLYNYKNNNRTYCKCIGLNDSEYKEYIIRQDALQSGLTNSTKGACSGGQAHDITGQRNEIEPTMNNLTRYHTLSCGCRKNSKWEIFIQKYLISNNVSFVPQKIFSDCLNKNNTHHLYFDFYLPDFNTIVEYDGKQHYEPVKIWGGEERFKKQQENDEIKNKYCEEHNIKIIRIPYTKKEEEIIQIINDIIRPVTTTVT